MKKPNNHDLPSLLLLLPENKNNEIQLLEVLRSCNIRKIHTIRNLNEISVGIENNQPDILLLTIGVFEDFYKFSTYENLEIILVTNQSVYEEISLKLKKSLTLY